MFARVNTELTHDLDGNQGGRLALGRWMLSLALVPLPVFAVLSVAGIENELRWTEWLGNMAWRLLGAEILSYAVGSVVFLVSALRRLSIGVTSCLWLGATVGFLTIISGRLLQFAVTGELHDRGIFSDAAGRIFVSFSLSTFGLPGGALLWCLTRRSQSKHARQLGYDVRLWRDFRLWRLGLGGVAYMVPLALFAAMYIAAGNIPGSPAGPTAIALVSVWFVAVWPVLGGSALLAVVLRLRPSAAVRRTDCIAIGMVVAFLDLLIPVIPFALADVTSLKLEHAFAMFRTVLLYSGVVTPLGFLGGWFFWLIAVRPLPALEAEWATFE